MVDTFKITVQMYEKPINDGHEIVKKNQCTAEHSVADDVSVDLFQQGCIRLFRLMRQYLPELGEHPFA